ncbi:MAG: c-type cytochrome biogenesis protein CcsB [Thermodesulfovibrionales bacterium]|nr:c-type cytochrome biogenesis protein CcsB [Thermodesulfovibrionales bacterium]
MESSQFFAISSIAYILAMVAYIAYLVFKSSTVGIVATTITTTGFISQTIAFFIRGKEFYDIGQMGIMRAIPLTNLYESLIFFVWCLILGYLIIEWKYKNRSFGAFVTPIAGMALAFIDITGMSKAIQPLIPALQSNWLLAHVTLSFIAYATFALSFATAIMYLAVTSEGKKSGAYIFWTATLGIFLVVLIAMGLDFFVAGEHLDEHGHMVKSGLFRATFKNASGGVAALSYLAALGFMFIMWKYGYVFKKIIGSFSISGEMLDDLTYKCIAIGFPIFTLGGLIFGAIWADQAWGKYWSWDPKETWSLITWFVYAFYLHARFMRGWRGKRIAMVAAIGFVSTVFTYLGVNLLLSGLHAYGGV